MLELKDSLAQLLALLANFPILMLILFLFARLQPLKFATVLSWGLALMTLYGFFVNRDAHYLWFLDTASRLGFLNEPLGVEAAQEFHDYARGIYHTIVTGLGVIIVGWLFVANRRSSGQ
ncbi:MAG: hypothetical protein HWE20_07400 [Gammaproteobacteria bacterium]|nr:hypothetical protein [Gammaproteobacteria bacterium]